MSLKSILSISLLLFAVSFVASFSSCSENPFETVVEIDVPEQDSLLVVNCIFRTNNYFNIEVYRSAGPLEDTGQDFLETLRIRNATVNLYEGSGNDLTFIAAASNVNDGEQYVPFTMPYTEGEPFPPPIQPEAGKTYTVEVSAPGFETVTTTTHAPEVISIQSAEVLKARHYDEAGDYYRTDISFTFQDPTGVSNFYYLNLQAEINDPWGSFVESQCYTTQEPTFTSQTEGEIIEIEGESFFCYDYNKFTDNFFTNELKTMEITLVDYNYEEEGPAEVHITLGHMSEDLYYYQVSTNLQTSTEGNPFAEPAIVYENVEGGLGIFGAYDDMTFTLSLE